MIQVGEYWWARYSDDHEEHLRWLFLIVASTTYRRRRLVLGIKCNARTRAPFVSTGMESSNSRWFLEDTGRCLLADLPDLYRRATTAPDASHAENPPGA